jgi:hypothetical protein
MKKLESPVSETEQDPFYLENPAEGVLCALCGQADAPFPVYVEIYEWSFEDIEAADDPRIRDKYYGVAVCSGCTETMTNLPQPIGRGVFTIFISYIHELRASNGCECPLVHNGWMLGIHPEDSRYILRAVDIVHGTADDEKETRH